MANDIVFIEQSRKVINFKLEFWVHTLETKSFRLGKSKIEYMSCNFSERQEEHDFEVKMGDDIPHIHFHHLFSWNQMVKINYSLQQLDFKKIDGDDEE